MNEKIRIHRLWKDMLIRCSEEYRKRYPTYKDCEILEEWLIFENFYSDIVNIPFYDAKDDKGIFYSLDKDMLGLELYSKDTVCFIPSALNSFFTNRQRTNNGLPIGVSYEKSRNKYKAKLSRFGKSKHLGYFDTKEKAYEEYCKARNEYAFELSEYYQGKVDERVSETLRKYDEEIWL